jgi:hypothetical protein
MGKTVPYTIDIRSVKASELNYREDGRIEWVCKHGIGHTIFAPKQMGKAGFIHGCDGCESDIICKHQNTLTPRR